AAQLGGTARNCGLPALVDVAGRLERLAAAKSDWVEIVRVTHDLLELCRSTQSIYLREARNTGRESLPEGSQSVPRRKDPLSDTKLAAAAVTEKPKPFTPPPMFGF